MFLSCFVTSILAAFLVLCCHSVQNIIAEEHKLELSNTSTERNEFDSTEGNETQNELLECNGEGYLFNAKS